MVFKFVLMKEKFKTCRKIRVAWAPQKKENFVKKTVFQPKKAQTLATKAANFFNVCNFCGNEMNS